MKTSIFTRLLCALLCICMLLPLLASCGIEWDDPDYTPGGNTPGGSGGNTPGGDTPGGDTETTYYKVSFAVALEEYKSRVTLPQEKLYKAGTEIQYLPTPAVRDMLFMGWYYDAAMTRPVALTDKVNGDLVLYAKVVDTSGDIAVIEGVYYHTVYDVEANYIFSLKADNIEQVTGYLSIVNISSAGEPLVYGEDYTVTKSGEGIFDVAVSYKPGKTYRASVEADQGVSFVVDGIELSAKVTTLNVLTKKEEVANLQLSDGLIYIPKAQVDMLTDTPNGLVSISDSGASVNSGSVGYFTYDGAVLKSGDKVAVYEGEIPSARDFGTDNGAVKYLTVTSVKGNNTYEYRISDTKEVLFIPDIIPVSGKTNPESEAQIAISSLDFTSDLYTQLGMDEDTVIEIGDYIAFFDGPMTADTPVEYVKIIGVDRDNQYYYIDYVPTTYDNVIASMDLYHTRTNTPDLSDAQLEEIKEQVYTEAINSGFVEEAADYLVNLYVSTNGMETMPDGTTVRYYPKMRANARSGGSGLYYEVTKCEAEPDVKVGQGVLKHFEESDGIRVELTLSFEIEFTVGEEGKNKVVISAEAVFEEEILLSLNVEGGAVWETAWIFPYIADYEMNANIDIGTYTGVSAVAKVYTNNGEEKEEEEDDDSFFPDFDFDKIGDGDGYEE
ncbi:MAG: InlB B-repeat-containing protein, partial [Clostridia bacterium]|nr:InlB B-repeat-containing protein [Clostridia bacterium]